MWISKVMWLKLFVNKNKNLFFLSMNNNYEYRVKIIFI